MAEQRPALTPGINVGPVYEKTSDGSDIRWDDLRFPVQSINPPGQASDPDVEATTGTLLFDAAGTELVYVVAQTPHSWLEQSEIRPHIHWQKSTSAAGNVLWQLDYEVVNNGAVAAMNYPNELQVTTPVAGTPDDDTADRILISAFDPIDMTGYNISCIVLFKLSRIGGDVLDTYGADARFLEFDFHYIVDGLGSAAQFEKESWGR